MTNEEQELLIAYLIEVGEIETKPESTEGGRRVSVLKWPKGAPLNLG